VDTADLLVDTADPLVDTADPLVDTADLLVDTADLLVDTADLLLDTADLLLDTAVLLVDTVVLMAVPLVVTAVLRVGMEVILADTVGRPGVPPQQAVLLPPSRGKFPVGREKLRSMYICKPESDSLTLHNNSIFIYVLLCMKFCS
jgi:hypothetical protein